MNLPTSHRNVDRAGSSTSHRLKWLLIGSGLLSLLAIAIFISSMSPGHTVLLRRFIYRLLWWLANFVTCLVALSIIAIVLQILFRRIRRNSRCTDAVRTSDAITDRTSRAKKVPVKLRLLFTLFFLWLPLEVLGLVTLWQQQLARQSDTTRPLLMRNLPRSPPGVLTVVAIGGSTTKGAPYSDFGIQFSFTHLTAWQLERRHPGLSVYGLNFGKDGASLSHMVGPLQILTFRPDVLLIYSGHNEFLRLTPEWKSLGQQPEFILDVDRIEQRFPPLSFLARAMAQELLSTDFAVAPRQSERRLFDVPLCGPQQMDQVYERYQSSMAEIVTWCRTEGILPIVIVPASNASGIGPNRSWLSSDFPVSGRERLAELWQQISMLPLAAPQRLALLEQARDIAPAFAETWYQLGREYDAAGRADDANVAFQRAIDYDGNPHRATSRIADICHAQPAVVIDTRELWRPLSTRRILGDWQFHDYCHPTLSSYLVLSNAIVAAIEAEGLPHGSQPNDVPPLAVAEVADHFQIDREAWQRVFEVSSVEWQRLSQYRFDPLPSRVRAAACADAARDLKSGTYPERDGVPRFDVLTALGRH